MVGQNAINKIVYKTTYETNTHQLNGWFYGTTHHNEISEIVLPRILNTSNFKNVDVKNV